MDEITREELKEALEELITQSEALGMDYSLNLQFDGGKVVGYCGKLVQSQGGDAERGDSASGSGVDTPE